MILSFNWQNTSKLYFFMFVYWHKNQEWGRGVMGRFEHLEVKVVFDFDTWSPFNDNIVLKKIQLDF